MNTYDTIATRIAREQEQIIGPIAWKEAKKVSGLHINDTTKEITVDANDKTTIDRLVAQYERFFGRVSHDVCKDAVRDLVAHMKPEEIPQSLK